MMHESVEYSIGAVASLSGVTVRTLHHFDRIGLLVPQRTGTGRYRVYRHSHLLRLQEILVYRAAGLPLSDIAAMLVDDRDRLARLALHLTRLVTEQDRLAAVRATLEQTIHALKGDTRMPVSDLYAPFPPEQQAAHESWLIGRGIADAGGLARSRAAVQAQPGGLPALMAALRAVEQRMVTAMVLPPGDPVHHGLMEDHRALMAQFWGAPCDTDAYRGLAQVFAAHGGFATHFEQVAPGLADWVGIAMEAHAERLTNI